MSINNEPSDYEFDADSEHYDNEALEDTPTSNCDNCGELVYEDAEQCPYCFEYLTTSSQTEHSVLTKSIVWLLIISIVLSTLFLAISMLVGN